jgi:hypothetical protein
VGAENDGWAYSSKPTESKMSKFFLHQVFANYRISDPDGDDFQTLHDARLEALAAAREIISNALRAGRGLVRIDFEIADQAGNILSVVPFHTVLEPR